MQSIDADRYDELGREVSGSGEQHSGQVRMAYRLAVSHRDRLLYVHGIGWHTYDGTRWCEDEKGAAQRAVLEVLRDALAESVGDKQLRVDVAKCESKAGVEGVLGIAAALVEFAATVDDLDGDPYLLNVANGTLDLRTMDLQDHNPADRLTRVTAGAYRPGVDPGEWGTFLASVLPDEDERAYLQRVIGQALYGRVTEHLFPVLIGEGANGKGTFYGAVEAALGDYATVIDPSLLMASDKGRSPGPELMELLGARLVIGSETEEGRKLDEPTMKRLTGGDKLTARRLYREPVTWTPSHQIVYVTNHKPEVKGNDPAVWRRIRVVPFEVIVPVDKRDGRLPERLLLHADAILAWAVAGYVDYRENGMSEPASVVQATGEYQADSDAVGRFLTEGCMTSPASTATSRDLFTAWQRWAIAEGAEVITEKAFGKELDRRGYPAKRTNRGAVRTGLAPFATDGQGGGDGW